jgi:predicted AlkP superfamily pyrophosphatase or phosphodiesterase
MADMIATRDAYGKALLEFSDKYDFIAVYNGNYDGFMHRYAPESAEALAELRANVRTYGIFDAMIREHWKNHRTLVGFATDHGCHEIDGGCGSHGLAMDEDLNITHFYRVYNAEG